MRIGVSRTGLRPPRGASEAHARGLARARASRVRASPAKERVPSGRGGWYQGVGEVRFQVTWGEKHAPRGRFWELVYHSKRLGDRCGPALRTRRARGLGRLPAYLRPGARTWAGRAWVSGCQLGGRGGGA